MVKSSIIQPEKMQNLSIHFLYVDGRGQEVLKYAVFVQSLRPWNSSKNRAATAAVAARNNCGRFSFDMPQRWFVSREFGSQWQVFTSNYRIQDIPSSRCGNRDGYAVDLTLTSHCADAKHVRLPARSAGEGEVRCVTTCQSPANIDCGW